jgi:hypothetical protein
MEPNCDLETSWMQQKTFRQKRPAVLRNGRLNDLHNSWCTKFEDVLKVLPCLQETDSMMMSSTEIAKLGSRNTLEIVSMRWKPLNTHKLQSHPISISLVHIDEYPNPLYGPEHVSSNCQNNPFWISRDLKTFLQHQSIYSIILATFQIYIGCSPGSVSGKLCRACGLPLTVIHSTHEYKPIWWSINSSLPCPSRHKDSMPGFTSKKCAFNTTFGKAYNIANVATGHYFVL